MLEVITPSTHTIAVLILTGIALVLFTRESIPLETSSLLVIVALAVGFELFPYLDDAGKKLSPSEFFYGFGHKALVAVSALMILGQGLVRTGALEPVGRYLAILWRRGPALSLLATLLVAALLSAFINNTPIVVLLLPLLIGVAIRTDASPSGMLLPMGLASLVGGMATTIGTSTNLLVVSVAADMGVPPFALFDFFKIAAVAGGVAILYLWLVAPRLLPDRRPPMVNVSTRLYTAQIELTEDSVAAGEQMYQAIERTDGRMQLERIQRGPDAFVTPLPDVTLRAGDRITVTESSTRLREFAEALGGVLYAGDLPVDEENPLSAKGQQLAEVAITNGSSLVGKALTSTRLKSLYGLRFLALHRAEEGRRRTLDHVILRPADVLLVQAQTTDLGKLKAGGDFLVLDGGVELPHTSKAPLALLIMIAVVATAAFGILPIEIGALTGCLLMLVSGCINWRDAASALSTQVVLIVVASLALGAALMRTGGADYLASLFLVLTSGLSPPYVLSGLILLMALLTNVVSNNAAAVIGTPIAIGIATRLGLPIEPFVLAVLFGANLSFATPMAYKTNLLVMNAGGYSFGDFVRVGVPLMLIMWVVLSITLVQAYQL